MGNKVDDSLLSCPCCGYKTLDERGDFEICPVCWWEDDGQDNDKISIISETFGTQIGGPNRVELPIARYNFIAHGICEPERTDLKTKAHPPEKYIQGRIFIFDKTSKILREAGTDWICDLTNYLE
jgi:hypothetical protein